MTPLTYVGTFLKDLRLLESEKRPLESIIIVDNLATSFANQLGSGLPIRAFINDKEDKELAYLAKKLLKIDSYSSVEEFIDREFSLKKFYASLEY